jgi:hypothetical protein
MLVEASTTRATSVRCWAGVQDSRRRMGRNSTVGESVGSGGTNVGDAAGVTVGDGTEVPVAGIVAVELGVDVFVWVAVDDGIEVGVCVGRTEFRVQMSLG